MPRTKAQYDDIRSTTKKKIQAAGLRLFSHKGFAATSISDIAATAAISTGLMYRHYSSKEELFFELANHAITATREITRLLDAVDSPTLVIKNLTRNLIDALAHSDESGQYFMLMIQFFLSEDTQTKWPDLQYDDFLFFDQMARLIQKGQLLGEFRNGNALQMAMFYFSSIQGIGISRLVAGERFIVPDPDMVTAFLFKEPNADS